MKPLAVVLDILQGDKGVFLGIGLVLPLITRLKDLMNQRVYLHHGPIRDRVLEKVDKRYYNLKCFFLLLLVLCAFFFFRFGKLFRDPWYLMAALTHPCFKAHWIKDRRSQEEAKIKLRQLIQDSTCSPVLEKSKTSLAEEFLLFDEIQPSGRPDDEVDRFLKDRDTSIGMLDNYPQIKSLFVKYNTVIPTSAPVERLFSLAALILTIRRNKLSDSMLEMLIFLKIALNL